MISAVGLEDPFPVVLHLRNVDGLDLLVDVGLWQLDGGDAVGVKSAAVMADLAHALLQGREPSGDEGEDEVIGPQFLRLGELIYVVDVGLELSPRITGVVLPV